MILKGKERGGGAQFGAYLLNTEKNEHVEVHAVSGFMSDNLEEALREITALAQGTRCTNYMFSVVLSPPEGEIVDTKAFEDAVTRIADKMGLQNQPYVLAFHEKDGHRHAHAVWSRIDTQTMRAINLPYYKKKLTALSKELFLEHGWKLPQGFIDRAQRNPLNFTPEEWKQAQRLGDDPRTIIAALKESWTISGSKTDFEKALEQRGYYLAKGDRRGYVAVDWRGEVYSLSRKLGVRTKVLKERLGEPSKLPSVDEAKARIDSRLVERVRGVIGEIRQDYKNHLAPLLAQRAKLQARHQNERQNLILKQTERWQQETRQRQARMNKGFRGLWDRLSGRHTRIVRQNEAETYAAYVRDREQKDNLIQGQLQERQSLQQGIRHICSQQEVDIRNIKEKLFSGLSKEKGLGLQQQFERLSLSQKTEYPTRGDEFDLSM